MTAEVVAALIRRGARFLICQRPAHKARGLLWEFVGGKIEPGESGPEALRRECREELGIDVDVGAPFCTLTHAYPDLTVHLTLYQASIPCGEPQLLEHAALAWITPREIPHYEFCPADREILARLRAQAPGGESEPHARQKERNMDSVHEMADRIAVNIQSSVRLAAAGLVWYVDPLGEPGDSDADYIFITHDHHDHFSPEAIARVSRAGTTLVVPRRMASEAAAAAPGCRICAVEPEERLTLGALTVETVPAYNLTKRFHPRASGWVGYVFEADGVRVYVSGDSDATPEARAVACDIALLPIGGTYTTDAREAAGWAAALRAAIVIPTHYGSFVGGARDADVFAAALPENIELVRKLTF